MAHYERAEVAWYRAVFGPDVPWNQTSNTPIAVIDEPSVDMLYGLADYIDATDVGGGIDLTAQRCISTAVDDVLVLLADDALTLGPAEKRYVYELIESIRGVLSESRTFGSVELLHHAHELFGYLTLLSDSLSADQETADLGGKFRDAARRVVPFLRFGTGFATGTLGALADFQQIMS